MYKKVSVIMGSCSDWQTMVYCNETLTSLGIEHNCEVISAHRTPDKMFHFAEHARSNGVQVIIAGAGGAAHLPGMVAAKTSLPVIGVPIKSQNLSGIDSLLSIAQMPKGVCVATMSIGKPGAINAAILAASILSLTDKNVLANLEFFRQQQTNEVLSDASLI